MYKHTKVAPVYRVVLHGEGEAHQTPQGLRLPHLIPGSFQTPPAPPNLHGRSQCFVFGVWKPLKPFFSFIHTYPRRRVINPGMFDCEGGARIFWQSRTYVSSWILVSLVLILNISITALEPRFVLQEMGGKTECFYYYDVEADYL